jgi:hypothetical protein
MHPRVAADVLERRRAEAGEDRGDLILFSRSFAR